MTNRSIKLLLVLTATMVGCNVVDSITNEAPPDESIFLLIFKNNTLAPIMIREEQDFDKPGVFGFRVEALDKVEVSRLVELGKNYKYRAQSLTGPLRPDVLECTFTPPVHRSPAREVVWTGSALLCANW